MFLKFNSTEQRRAYGGSAFLELQYCKLPVGTSERKLVSSGSICFWDISSLYVYVDDMDAFYAEYRDILDNGTKALDLCGINHYSAEATKTIVQETEARRPQGYEVFLEWLRENPHHNGFYILGI